MRPAFLDQMSWEMAEVYGAVTDEILINLAHYFPYYNQKNFPRSSITYQADMLAQLGQVNKETMRIIRRNLQGASPALKKMLEQVIIDSVQAINPPLVEAVRKNIFAPPSIPIVEPNQMRAFQLYYQQAADKLNLVNTVMLESTQQAYQATVADIAARVQATQTALDIGAGETITGVSTWNKATQHAISRLQRDGITGFIDHAGHRWSAEAYVAMDIRTTVYNTGRAAVWETNQSFGNDLYQVSYHNGARPLCYPWQNKVISSTDMARTVVDLDGNEVQVYAQSETTYGQAAGLFGVNCRHYPNPFIPGVSVIRGEPQDPKANDRTYEESQYQRSLERKIREDKRDLLMLKAQGAPEELIEAQTEKVRADNATITEFCDKTGRARHKDREGVYTKRSFPSVMTYDVDQFAKDQRRMINSFYQQGGAQQGYAFGQMVPKTKNTPHRVEFGELFDSRSGSIAESVNSKITSMYKIDERLGFVGDVRISRDIPHDMDVFDLHETHGKTLTPATAQYISKGNKIPGMNGRAVIEVHSENVGLESIEEYFAGVADVRKRMGKGQHLYYATGGLEGTLVHEYGHFVADYYGVFSGPYTEKAQEFRNWLFDYWRNNNEAVKEISLYAASSPDEMLAEAFAQSFDTMHTDTTAYKTAKEIMDRFHAYIGFDPGR